MQFSDRLSLFCAHAVPENSWWIFPGKAGVLFLA